MTVYANLVDGEVKGVYDLIPKFWNGINHFDVRCREDAEFMQANNFVKIIKQNYNYNPETHYLSIFPTYTVENNQVLEHRQILEKIETVAEPISREVLLETVRKIRDEKMSSMDWRYNRYHRQIRLGLEPTDSIQRLDAYMQSLADITLQEDLENIIWPEY
jgi:hypothetical protein